MRAAAAILGAFVAIGVLWLVLLNAVMKDTSDGHVR